MSGNVGKPGGGSDDTYIYCFTYISFDLGFFNYPPYVIKLIAKLYLIYMLEKVMMITYVHFAILQIMPCLKTCNRPISSYFKQKYYDKF